MMAYGERFDLCDYSNRYYPSQKATRKLTFRVRNNGISRVNGIMAEGLVLIISG